jgi:histone acetyltransferase HTATIP
MREEIGCLELPHSQVAVYKIDGEKEKLFCQNLCLFSKMFLDGKTLIWEVRHDLLLHYTWPAAWPIPDVVNSDIVVWETGLC